MKILGIAGSLRAGSHNRALLRAAAELAPEGVEIAIWERLRDLPHYDGDLDVEGKRPDVVAELKREIGAADALLIATPEYGYSIPGVLKNAIDWASRPGYRSELVGKPVAIMGASGGAIGTARAQAHLRETLYSTLARVFPHPGVAVGGAGGRFADGRLTDEATRRFVALFLRQFARFVRDGTVEPLAPPPPPKPAG